MIISPGAAVVQDWEELLFSFSFFFRENDKIENALSDLYIPSALWKSRCRGGIELGESIPGTRTNKWCIMFCITSLIATESILTFSSFFFLICSTDGHDVRHCGITACKQEPGILKSIINAIFPTLKMSRTTICIFEKKSQLFL